ncbi:hypothetical protein Tco_0044113 [Tanacetum coccineum]
MSSDNTSSAVTYTSISSDSDGPSWGIPLMNVGELPEMDPYEEVAQQGHASPLSHVYVPDPMELENHIPLYIPKLVYPEYHVPLNDDIQIEDQPYAADALPSALSLGYIAESDPEEDLEEDSEEDPIDFAIDADDDEEEEEEHLAHVVTLSTIDPISSIEETDLFETDESTDTPPPPPPPPPAYRTTSRMFVRTRHLYHFLLRKRLLLTAPTPRFKIGGSSTAAAARQPRSTMARRVDYGFVDTLDASIRASEQKAMAVVESVNLRVNYQASVHRQESEEFQIRHQDAQDDHATLRDEVDTLRRYLSSLCTTHE